MEALLALEFDTTSDSISSSIILCILATHERLDAGVFFFVVPGLSSSLSKGTKGNNCFVTVDCTAVGEGSAFIVVEFVVATVLVDSKEKPSECRRSSVSRVVV